jgi:hypothetical protein
MDRKSVLPDLVIGGAPRSGTTFLCEVLSKHPDVFVSRPIIPEPKVCLTAHPNGVPGFRARYAALFRDAPPNSLRVEKTSNYFENSEARGRLRAVLPDARFVFILREPVARAYSNWLWSGKNGLEKLSFSEAIAREGARANPLAPEQEYARPFDYMSRGRYATFARGWIEAVGRERISFLIFEDVVRDPQPWLHQLQLFAGLPPVSWSELQTETINSTQPMPDIIDPVLIARLRADTRQEVEAFAQLTGVDISAWGY